MSLRSRLALGFVCVGSSLLAGCGVNTAYVAPVRAASSGISGMVHGGQQPVAGATIQLYTVGTTGDGSPATALISLPVLTDAGGNFSITGKYSCSAATLVYITATGGNPGATAQNPNIAMMTALGPCSNLTSGTFITINELTTVAAVDALSPYAQSLGFIGSASSDLSALTSAFTLAGQLVSTVSGLAPGAGVPAGYSVQVAQLNSLADIAASCVNSSGGTAGDGSACGNLFALSTPQGFNNPADTFAALLNIADFPTLNTAALFNLIPPAAPFQPLLPYAPYSFAAPLILTANSNQIVFSPSSLSFPVTTVGQTMSQTVVVKNTSASAFTSYSAGEFLGYPDVNTGSLSTCYQSQTIAAGATCTIIVNFSPRSVGSFNGAVGFQAANGPLITFPVSGTSVAPAGNPQLTLSQTLINYTIGGLTHDVTVTNTGGGLLNISGVSNASPYYHSTNTCTLGLVAGATCVISITENAPRNTLNGTSGYYDTAVVASNDTTSYNQILLVAQNTATVSLTPAIAGFTISPLLSYNGTASNCNGDSCKYTGPNPAGDYLTNTLYNAFTATPGTYYATGIATPNATPNNGTYQGSGITLINGSTASFTLTNPASSSVPIRKIMSTTPAFTESDNCGTSLFAQSICTVTITPNLTIPGLTVGQLVLSYDVGGTPGLQTYVVSVSNSDILRFGSWPVGTTSNIPHYLGVGNGGGSFSGNNTGDFTPTTSCPSATGGGLCLLATAFKPTTTGLRSASMDFFGTIAGNLDTLFLLTGTGTAAGPNLLFYGAYNPTTAVGTATTTTISAGNTGSTPLILTNCTITGTNAADFSFATNPCPTTLATAAQLNFNVVFAPTSAGGVRTAIVSFTDATSLQTYSQTLTAFASYVTPSITPSPFIFPATNIGASTTQSIPVTRSLGHAITASLSSSTNFMLTKSTCAVNESPCNLTATFNPTVAAGSGQTYLTTTLTLVDYVGGLTGTATLEGVPGNATLTSNPTSFSFITRPVGSTSIPQSVTLSNSGTTALTITGFALGGANASEFTYTTTCPTLLSAGANCTLSASFAPLTPGGKSAMITVNGNGNLPLVIPITGAAQ